MKRLNMLKECIRLKDTGTAININNLLTTERYKLLDLYFIWKNQYHERFPYEVMGFRIGDTVRLRDGDGRHHIIKRFELCKGWGSTFYRVEFEDNSATDHIFPEDILSSASVTNMVKIIEL